MVAENAPPPSSPSALPSSPPQPSVHQKIRNLEAAIRRDPIRNANNASALIALIDPENTLASTAIHATRRSLLAVEKRATTPAVQDFLTAHRKAYTNALVSILQSVEHPSHYDAAVASAALVHPSVFRTLLSASLSAIPILPSTRVVHACLGRFSDLTVLALQLLASPPSDAPLTARLSLLSACTAAPSSTPARSPVPIPTYRTALSDAWLTTLRDPQLTNADRLNLLTDLPTRLLPNIAQPLRLADILTAAYDASNDDDGALALAALDGLYHLIANHRLDYSRFYHRLYALLTPYTIAHAPHRHRFLHLTSNFLRRGSRLPGSLVAAFIKRLVRRALTAPAAAGLWCLRLALDLLYAHPAVSFLVHRSVDVFADAKPGKKRKRTDTLDPFDDCQSDPDKSNAELSSLWELEVLSNHLSPAVTRLVALFSHDVRHKPPLLPGTLEDYGNLSFNDVFCADFNRKTKAHHVAYDAPGTALQTVQLEQRLSDSVVWT